MTARPDVTESRPAAESVQAGGYPTSPVDRGHTAPVAKRVRAFFDGALVLDTADARYVWEHPYYPHFYIPATDIRDDLLRSEGRTDVNVVGLAQTFTLVHGDRSVEQAARLVTESEIEGLAGTYRFDWDALDAWFEEDEEVFLHPRSPYVRVDSMRSTREVRIEKDSMVLAESTSPIALFETGLPRRWYLDKTGINWEHLVPSDTRTRCPYKGTTSGYWSVRVGEHEYMDVAWSYDFPTRECAPIAGLVCFYDEKFDVFVDGIRQN